MMIQNKWKADSKITVVESGAGDGQYSIVDGVHRYYSLSRLIEAQYGIFTKHFQIPAIILKAGTPPGVLAAYAAAVNYQGSAQVIMSYLDNCLAVIRSSQLCIRKETNWFKLSATDITKAQKRLIGGTAFAKTLLPKLWAHILYMVTEQDAAYVKVIFCYVLN